MFWLLLEQPNRFSSEQIPVKRWILSAFFSPGFDMEQIKPRFFSSSVVFPGSNLCDMLGPRKALAPLLLPLPSFPVVQV